MAQSHRMRRGRLGIMAGFLGASVAIVGFAGPAGAATVPAQNHMVIGSGSNTTYIMMTQLGDLFNESPGCDLAVPSGTQNQDFRCPNPQNTTGGENGLGDGSGYANGGSIQQGDPENPYNDVVVEEPPLGSSNGIKQLDQRGTNNAPVDFARSSRGPNNGLPAPVGDPVNTTASDPSGLNFVAYAADAVPWLHWTKVSGSATPSAKIKSLSITQLQSIYNGNTTDWSQISKGKAGPIVVYTAQNGSGTEGTWQSELGLTVAGPTLFPGVKDTAHVIFENEIHGILLNGDEKNAIFFFSYGKFQTDCVSQTAKAKTATCGADKSPSGSAFALGAESITTGGQSITPSQTTILNGSFPTDRYLYNVYSNGTNGTFPASSQATLNFVSEWGFICKQDSAVDSNSGATYASEIQNVITANGFFPLSSALIDAANVDSNAHISDPGYAFVDPQSQASNPSSQQGRCRVFTTDGDGVS